MSFLFIERTPPRLVVLSLGALTFASIGILLGTSWLLVAYGQDLFRTIGLRFLAIRVVLGFLNLFILLATSAYFLEILVISIDSFVPLDCFCSSRVSIGQLEKFGDSSRRI